MPRLVNNASFNQIFSNLRAISIFLPIYFSFHFCLYVLCVICLIGGVPRMGPRVPFALLPLGIYIYLIKYLNLIY